MARTRNPQVWMQQALQGQGKQVSERYEVKATELPFEFMLNVLRLKDGVPYEYFTARAGLGGQWISKAIQQRSEEHTSELQSRGHLVCRLLLEKKKTNTTI